jgi:predicted DNA-binding WGR domain protein
MKKPTKKTMDVTPLMMAINDGKLPAVKQAIADGIDPCQPDPKDSWGSDGEEGVAAIHYAFARNVSPSIGAYLLTLPGLDWNTPAAGGRTPLHILVGRCGGKDTPARMKALVAAGADINKPDEGGLTPLFYLGFYYRAAGEIELWDSMLAAGADANHKDDEGLTALDYLYAEMRGVKKYTDRLAKLIAHVAAKGAKSRYAKEELALAQDPNVWIDNMKAKKTNAVPVAKAWLALGRAYGRVGEHQGMSCARRIAYNIAAEHKLTGPRYLYKGKDFWELTIDGATITIRVGKNRDEGKETVEKLANPAAADARAKLLIEQQMGKGYEGRTSPL